MQQKVLNSRRLLHFTSFFSAYHWLTVLRRECYRIFEQFTSRFHSLQLAVSCIFKYSAQLHSFKNIKAVTGHSNLQSTNPNFFKCKRCEKLKLFKKFFCNPGITANFEKGITKSFSIEEKIIHAVLSIHGHLIN